MFRREWHVFALVVLTVAISFFPRAACALDASDTRLLSTPAFTEGKIAFVYADDIWLANSDGTNPRRVTAHPGEERNPYFALR